MLLCLSVAGRPPPTHLSEVENCAAHIAAAFLYRVTWASHRILTSRHVAEQVWAQGKEENSSEHMSLCNMKSPVVATVGVMGLGTW